jgi:hypothetical protein
MYLNSIRDDVKKILEKLINKDLYIIVHQI